MKMHLRIAFGVSTSFYISGTQLFKGASQGNGTAPTLFRTITIFNHISLSIKGICNYYRSFVKIRSTFIIPSHTNDTNLCVFDLGSDEKIEVLMKYQSLLNSQYGALKSTWRYFKLSKWYQTLQYYLWQDGDCTHSTTTSETIYIQNNNYNITKSMFLQKQ